MSENHGFRPPSNERAKLFSKGKNSGPSGKDFSFPQIKPMPPPPQAKFVVELKSLPEPTHDYILVHIISKDMSEGGIVIPEIAQEKENAGAFVLKVGPGRVTENGSMIVPCCKPGDRVFIAPNPASMIPIQAEGKTCLLVNNMMILGIYPKEEEPVQSTEPTP